MANEIAHNHATGATLYACRFQLNGDVFLTSGASDEVWGTGGRDADDYDVSMSENGSGGHYVGTFDPSANIAEGLYRIAVYLQEGGSPVDSDIAIAQGIGEWDGTEFELCAKKQDVLDAHTTTDALITSSHGTTDGLIAALDADARSVKNVYGSDEPTAEGTIPESVVL